MYPSCKFLYRVLICFFCVCFLVLSIVLCVSARRALLCRVLGVGRVVAPHQSHPSLVCRCPSLPNTSFFSTISFIKNLIGIDHYVMMITTIISLVSHPSLLRSRLSLSSVLSFRKTFCNHWSSFTLKPNGCDDDDVYDADICSAVSTMERNPLNPDSCASEQPIVSE